MQKKTHHRSQSDVTVFIKAGHKRTPSTSSTKSTAGDLSSGRAFDNGCSCLDSSDVKQTSGILCSCGANCLQPQLEFVKGIFLF